MPEQILDSKPKPVVRTQKILITILLIIVVAGIFMLIGFKYGRYAGHNDVLSDVKLVSPEATTTAVVGASTTASATTTADATADWKTYTNSQYGFSFKYPGGWTITNNTPGQTGSVNQNLTIAGSDSEKLRLWINPDGFGFEGASDIYQAEILNGRISIISRDKRQPDADFPELTPQAVIGAISSSNINYTIAYNFDMANRESELKNFDQILSTFQFTK